MKNIALYLVHPSYEKESRINKALINAAKNLENITIYDLYKNYPDFKIDVKKEQERLLENDIVVLQFPLFWFSSPALLKEWFDLVFTQDFAFDGKYALKDKKLLVSTTAAGAEETYKESGILIEDYLKPIVGTAMYTKMQYQKPFIVHNTYVLSDEQLDNIAKEYVQYLLELSK